MEVRLISVIPIATEEKWDSRRTEFGTNYFLTRKKKSTFSFFCYKNRANGIHQIYRDWEFKAM